MLYKTTATFWTDFDPSLIELSDLAQRAESGDAFCGGSEVEKVEDPKSDDDWGEGLGEFFGIEEDE